MEQNFKALDQAETASFLNAVATAFHTAAADFGATEERKFMVAGHCFRVLMAGQGLRHELCLALEHLESKDPEINPELTICAWDSASTGVSLPPCPWPLDQLDPAGHIRGLDPEGPQVALQVEIGGLSVYDPARKLAFFRIADGQAFPAREWASPLKSILHWWLREKGLFMIHCAAVGTENGAALLVGHSGSGKSTTSLACLHGGLQFITDDRCLIALKPEPSAFCIYNAAKLWPEQMKRFPRLLKAVYNQAGPEDKSLLFVQRFAPGQLARELPIRVVLLCSIADREESSLSAVSSIRVLRDLMPSTFIYQPGAKSTELQAMAELLRLAPCRRINLGRNLEGIPGLISEAVSAGEARPALRT